MQVLQLIDWILDIETLITCFLFCHFKSFHFSGCWWQWTSTNKATQVLETLDFLCGFRGKFRHFGIHTCCLWKDLGSSNRHTTNYYQLCNAIRGMKLTLFFFYSNSLSFICVLLLSHSTSISFFYNIHLFFLLKYLYFKNLPDSNWKFTFL